jgi:hypothetical protein
MAIWSCAEAAVVATALHFLCVATVAIRVVASGHFLCNIFAWPHGQMATDMAGPEGQRVATAGPWPLCRRPVATGQGGVRPGIGMTRCSCRRSGRSVGSR